MQLGSIRPRFSFTVPGRVEDRIAELKKHADRPEQRCRCRVLGHHADLTVIEADRHRWSPCLMLEFEQEGDFIRAHGLIGPHPNLWTLFAFVNITNALLLAVALMWGFSQWFIDARPLAFLVALGCGALFPVMYAASQAGQRFAREQTHHLLDVVELSFGVRVREDPE